MRNTLLLATIILALSFVVFPQTTSEETKCPNVKIISPSSPVAPGETMIFAVDVSIISEENPIEYAWSIDKGSIIEGQGTSTITVATDGLDITAITAQVEISGLAKECQNKFSESGLFSFIGGFPRVIDEFGNLRKKDIWARIDAAFVEMSNNDENFNLFIFNYGKKKELSKREKLIKKHIKSRKYDEQRFVFINGGVEENIRTIIYLLHKDTDTSVFN